MGHHSKRKNLNYLPYLQSYNSRTKQTINLLLDTGANKNVIRPGIIEGMKNTKDTSIKNISGNHKINRQGKANLIGHNLPPQKYYELNFHNFFDGIIGSEYLAKAEAKIDYAEELLTIDTLKIPFKKYFPSKKLNSYTIEIKTSKDGDWVVPTFQKLHKNVLIEPGLYKSENNRSTIRILTNKNEKPTFDKKLKLKVNNFETITPIPLNKENKMNTETLDKIIRTAHLSKIEKKLLFETILNNQSILLKKNEKLTATAAIKHKIITNNEQPVYTKSYRYPQTFKKDVEEQIKELLDNGIIKHSTSPYSSPIWVVPKKMDSSGKRKVRVVIDYRKLNDKTVNDKFPIPQIEEILDSLGKSAYFTTLDLKSGFHQIEMDPKHQEKTAFSTALGHFEFLRMPFGLKNAPATFQRAMNNILVDLIGTICFVYLDDIIIIGENLGEHIKNLNTVLQRLADFNLKIQLDKCEFMRRETEFLGHVITPEGIKPDPGKVIKILDWKLPENPKQIKQFLGLSGYYRRFIKDYSKLAKPMTKYLKKGQVMNLDDEEYKKAFSELKNIIASDQVLAYPDFENDFILTTDASNYAVGAVLSQIQEKIERPIAFASRTLTKCETNYSTIEKEALAIMWGVEKFRPYLYGNKFKLLTDHKPLQFIKNCNKNPKILKWRTELENYNYIPEYKPGKTNVVADALSRKIEENEINVNEANNDENSSISGTPEDLETMSQLNNPSSSENVGSDAETVHSADDSADFYIHHVDRPINYYRNQIIFRIARITTIISETIFPHFQRTTIVQPEFQKQEITAFLKEYHNGRQSAILAPENLLQLIQESFKENFGNRNHFVFTSKLVEDVSNEDRQNLIITTEHDRAHRGTNEVEAQLRRAYFFPNMAKLIKKYSDACPHCNTHKYERKPYNIKITPRPITDKPFERIHMDIYIIAKHSFLSLVDSFSKHLQMNYIKTKNLTHVQKALSKYFSSFGIPKKIVTDHETTFRSIQLRNFLSQLGCCLEYAASSESNGQIERTHSTITEIYNSNKYKFQNLGTKSIVKLSVALYNESVHTSTKLKPNEIMFNLNNANNPEEIIGNAQKLFAEAKSNLSKAQARQTKYNPEKENPPNIREDEDVFVIPNTRNKTEPRAVQTTARNVKSKTFINSNNVKRHKSKIKRKRTR